MSNYKRDSIVALSSYMYVSEDLEKNLSRMSDKSLMELVNGVRGIHTELVSQSIKAGEDKKEIEFNEPEPPLMENGVRSIKWIKWYRNKYGASLKEASDESYRRIAKLEKKK